MNIVNKLTLRQLLLNKRRTLVTIIGVIISVAMITAVASLGISFMDMLRRQVISDGGEWHVLYENINKTQLEAIKSDEETKEVILSRELGYAYLEESQNNNKPYIFLQEYNKAGFENFPIKLVEGKLPERGNEIVISEAIIKNARVNYKIGDTLTFDIGQRHYEDDEGNDIILEQKDDLRRYGGTIQEFLLKETTKSYTIVGIIETPKWEYPWSPGYTAISYVDEDIINSNEEVNASVILKDINSKLFKNAESLASENGIKEPSFNNDLLRYYGVIKSDSLRNMLLILSAIVTAIIMIGSISLIYNAFAISVAERSRHLGMLSSVGATKKQKRNSVFFEGAVIGGVSIPIGIIAGLLGIGITFRVINSMIKGVLGLTENLKLVVSPIAILIAIFVSIITILISTYIPAKRASNVSAIDAIRQTQDIKIKGKEVKTSKLTRKIFGIEGELGLKNLKRNKARYRATVFSLIISMILFLAVSYFTSSLKKSLLLTQDGINFDMIVYFNHKDRAKQDEIINKITALDNISEDNYMYTLSLNSWLEEEFMSDYVKEIQKEALIDGKLRYDIFVKALDEEALKTYAKEVGLDYNKLLDVDNPSVIVIDTLKYEDGRTNRYREEKAIKTKVGEKLHLEFYDYELDENILIETVEIAALTDKVPMGVSSMGYGANFIIIVSENLINKIAEANTTNNINENINRTLYLKSDNPLKLQESIEEIQKVYDQDEISFYNLYMARQQEEQMVLIMSVFTYAFIFLITSICIANIFNTISTSIALRKREFAMLKSVGMTPESFNKMINYESIFYGIKALSYGLPISFAVMYLMHQTLMIKFSFGFEVPWFSALISVASVFIIVGSAMIYSSKKVKKENIIDALKQEII